MADEERNEDVTPEEEAPTPPEDAAPAEEEATPPEEEAAPAEEEAAPAAEPAAEAPAQADGEAPKAKDLPPGAELDPISLEPEKPVDAEERARLEAEEEERARLEAEATADGGEEPVARSGPRVELDEGRSIQATGKRKASIARVVVRAGSGSFEVNRRPLDEYFPRAHLQTVVRSALVTSGYEDSLDIAVRVQGGGIAGQAGAVRHGVAKALTEIDSDLRGELKRRGYLTRDARIKERRKAGLKKARKRPQFSKR